MDRLVYYSLAASKASPRPDLLWQLELSVRSLRTYNATVPVIVFTYGDLPPELAPALSPYDVTLHHQGSYQAKLARLAPHGWQVLSQYPVLHKFLNFSEIGAHDPEQVLYLDCDTIFFADVDLLFSRYASADCYGREEPTSSRSHYGYDASYLDEGFLAGIAASESINPPPPFNLGVVSLNNGIWRQFAALEPVFLSYAWRFAVWMAQNPPQGPAANYGEALGIAYLRQYFDQLTSPEDLERSLPYPSANRWIFEQVALWFALGHIGGLTYEDYSARDVLQNGEILTRSRRECDWVLCHYFSQNRERLTNWLDQTRLENNVNASVTGSLVP